MHMHSMHIHTSDYYTRFYIIYVSIVHAVSNAPWIRIIPPQGESPPGTPWLAALVVEDRFIHALAEGVVAAPVGGEAHRLPLRLLGVRDGLPLLEGEDVPQGLPGLSLVVGDAVVGFFLARLGSDGKGEERGEGRSEGRGAEVEM